MSIVEFLLVRITEDEVLARGAIEDVGEAGPWLVGADTADHLDPNTVFRPSGWAGHIVHACNTYLTGDDSLDVARHIARHDPARVLADCAAKRRIVEECAPNVAKDWPFPDGLNLSEVVVAELVKPYADHPEFNPAWRE